MNIRDWPAAERPREKLLRGGAGNLSDAELLAVLLGTPGQRGMNVVDMARGLLARHRSLRELLQAGPAGAAKNSLVVGMVVEPEGLDPTIAAPTTIREVTWGELQDISNRLANVLVGKGVGVGDRVAIILSQRPETAVAHVAASPAAVSAHDHRR